MSVKIFSTLSHKKENFEPIEAGKVRMYVCGPTVYDYIHIGNARPLVVFDTFHRFMKWRGYDVKYVVNFTDIDDKIINRANKEGVDFREITKTYIDAFMNNAHQLNLLEEETIHPKATEMIPEIIEFVQGLVDKGMAYEAEDAVYFDVSKDKEYGKLSGKKVEDLKAGARISVNDKKDDPMDFAVWKKQKEENEPAWPSPWGPGRPGWHIECSTMSRNILGDMIDIHAGGADLIFPHHENEIAQSEGLTGHTFSKYWMHNGMITVSAADGSKEKMSKSLGNFFTLNDIAKEFDLIVVRYWLLSTHYRSPINFSRQVMEQSKASYERLMNAKHNLERLMDHNESKELSEDEKEVLEEAEKIKEEFIRVMEDDLNTADGLTALFDLAHLANARLNESSSKDAVKEIYDLYIQLLNVMGLEDRTEEEDLDQEIEALIEERNQARKDKDFEKADAIRDKLSNMGIILKDTPTGVIWERKN